MKTPHFLAAPGTLIAALALSACASSPRAATPNTPAPASARSPADTMRPPTVSRSGVEQARVDSARRPYTDADVTFMTGMIGHHAQAIVMSKLAPSHGASPSVQTLAARIINAQTDEIHLMQSWLRDRNKPVPDEHTIGMRMTMNGMDHVMLMPGMLNDEQMARLDSARGPEFDRLFLSGMIQHHRGAVSMVERLFGTYGAAQDEFVFKFANDVNVDQTTEIARMQRMLATATFGTGAR